MRSMTESSRGASITLRVLLILEGLGALFVTLLNVFTSQALGQDFLPWESAFIPGGFGLLCLIAVFGLNGSSSWGKVLAAITQLLVLAGGVIALLDSARPLAWVVVGLGLLGLLLLSRTARRG